jgi:hypothetical protein
MQTMEPKLRGSTADSGITPGSSANAHCIRCALVGLVVGLSLLAFPLPTRAQGEVNSEYRVKLAFLYNFAQFVQWPADAFSGSAAPLVICVDGDNPFQGEIEESLRGRAVEGHPIQLRRLRPEENPHACQIIFVRATEMKAASRIFAGSKNSTTLTVGEANGFAQRGGIINLTREENRLRFEVNVTAAAQTRLKISSKLLVLAKIVKE